MENPHRHVFFLELFERRHQRAHRTLDVGLDDQIEFLYIALFDLAE